MLSIEILLRRNYLLEYIVNKIKSLVFLVHNSTNYTYNYMV